MIRQTIQNLASRAIADLGWNVPDDITVDKPKNNFSDYAVNVAFGLAKQLGKAPTDIAQQLAEKIQQNLPPEIERVEAAAGYVNFFLSPTFLQAKLADIASRKNWGVGTEWQGQTVMVEYTDPNPFKPFHIGHLMSNAIGEAIARLYEVQGAKVIRANYQGDVGLHVAKVIWGMQQSKVIPAEAASLVEKAVYLGHCYATGAQAYEDTEITKQAIEQLNQLIYAQSDPEINRLYQTGREWSLQYFETVYRRLGTKFDRYFFESEAGPEGLAIVQAHPQIFKTSAGAVIFPGEKYGLHNRVFINSKGLPTYEAKELGLNKKKFELYPELAQSVIVTGNEINDYFRVLLKAMELTVPEVATKTKHIGHGMLRLPDGKMSSRTGQVITAEKLLEQIKEKLRKIVSPKSSLDKAARETTYDPIAIGAVKYSILKQSPGRDIVFDFDKSLALAGDSGPYLQYTYARLQSILKKSEIKSQKPKTGGLTEPVELNITKHLIEFPEVVRVSARQTAPQHLALYLYELANLANAFYETVPVLKAQDIDQLATRLTLVGTTARTLAAGLDLLGIRALEQI